MCSGGGPGCEFTDLQAAINWLETKTILAPVTLQLSGTFNAPCGGFSVSNRFDTAQLTIQGNCATGHTTDVVITQTNNACSLGFQLYSSGVVLQCVAFTYVGSGPGTVGLYVASSTGGWVGYCTFTGWPVAVQLANAVGFVLQQTTINVGIGGYGINAMSITLMEGNHLTINVNSGDTVGVGVLASLGSHIALKNPIISAPGAQIQCNFGGSVSASGPTLSGGGSTSACTNYFTS